MLDYLRIYISEALVITISTTELAIVRISHWRWFRLQYCSDIYLSICLSVYLSVCVLIYLLIYLYIPIYLSISQSLYLLHFLLLPLLFSQRDRHIEGFSIINPRTSVYYSVHSTSEHEWLITHFGANATAKKMHHIFPGEEPFPKRIDGDLLMKRGSSWPSRCVVALSLGLHRQTCVYT